MSLPNKLLAPRKKKKIEKTTKIKTNKFNKTNKQNTKLNRNKQKNQAINMGCILCWSSTSGPGVCPGVWLKHPVLICFIKLISRISAVINRKLFLVRFGILCHIALSMLEFCLVLTWILMWTQQSFFSIPITYHDLKCFVIYIFHPWLNYSQSLNDFFKENVFIFK